ncbi:MAG: hypothetical protein ISR45_04670 [Rhodospirillales bacterium]|nr:hypothetical protein [Rhodospirillales bacterium]
MLIDKVTALRDHMNEEGVSFCFTGFMTEEVLSGIAQALKKKLELEKVDINTAKGIFSIVIELSQNIIRYSAEHKTSSTEHNDIDLRYGVLAVGHDENHHYVVCGNMVQKEDSERLSNSLMHIKGLDRKELKALYKQTLREGPPKGSKGAGVGFVEIAMRATQGFEFDFRENDDANVFFALRATI